jgi:hypothetical protein
MLVIASIGGLIAALDTKNTRARLGAMMLLPFAVGGIERHVPAPFQVRRVESTIDISAPADVVWKEIVNVREIGADELPPALYLRMGLPRPISATIDRDGIDAVRQARFDRGLLFLETVDEWELGRRLGFTIAAQTDLIPPTTLDPHVTIGGPYFDVLHGSYWIEPISTGQVRLHLESRLRVSTHLNWYAGRWADAIMASIQRTILVVEKKRAEAGSR